ncbi:MAG: 3'-5' exonuclease [Gemmatimonadaceae bacterium]
MTASPDSELLVRARSALAAGSLDAVTLMERVCALPNAPQLVAERLAEALFARHADFLCGADGRWALIAMGRIVPPGVLPCPPIFDPPLHVRERRRTETPLASDDVPLRSLRFAVVDVETTGMSPATGDRVTEIAIVHVEGGEVTEVYETLVNPERPIPPAIVALTRITWEMVAQAPRFGAVAGDVVGRLRERVFVAHNAAFDWRFVSHEVSRASGMQLTGDNLCTVRLARALLPQLPRRSLDAVTQYFGVEIGHRHRAAGDAIATAHVLTRLIGIAEDRGASTWRELTALLRPGTSRSRKRRSAMPRGIDVDPTL